MTSAYITLGLDLGEPRSVLVLCESLDGEPVLQSVGDGRGRYVGADWGPVWSAEFLTTVRRRVGAYLGLDPAEPAYPRCCVVGWPDLPADAAARCVTAGLSMPQIIGPADALLCSWLAEIGTPPSAQRITALAVGGGWAVATTYRVAGYSVTAGPQQRREVPGTAWIDVLAERFGSPERALEISTLIRIGSPPHVDGRLLGENDLRTSAASEVIHVARTLLTTEKADLVLLGGLCGAIPPLASAVAGLAPVWQPAEPTHVLAAGAALLPLFDHRLTRASEGV